MLEEPKYVVISPVKNEGRYLQRTIESMVSQTLLPILWLVVDDASTDGTGNLVKAAAARYPWIRYLLHPGETARRTGSAEIHAFDYGHRTLQGIAYDFIVKLDGDLWFGPGYFEMLLARFSKNATLGIASGVYLEDSGSNWLAITMPSYHAAGASKVVRRECFTQIGGFLAERGWDTVDEIRARSKGWETAHFTDIEFCHLRKEGTGMGQLHTNLMHGEIFFRMRGGFPFFVLKAGRRMALGKPFFLAGSAMIYGYFRALVRGLLGKQKPLVSPLEARTYRKMLNHRLLNHPLRGLKEG